VLERLEKSSDIRRRVINARKIQGQRFEKEDIFSNAEMKNSHISKYCQLSNDVEGLLKRVVSKYDLSVRAYFKLIRVARTISDLAAAAGPNIRVEHMAEAVQYRVRHTNLY
jgi:magnesium chelatase family protein